MSSSEFPELTADGFLPYDVHFTLDELEACPLVTGEGLTIRQWDAERRRTMAGNLRYVVTSLWDVGVQGEIGVDGSFAEACLKPRDVDVYCELTEDEMLLLPDRLERLNARDGKRLWTISDEDRVHVPGVRHSVSPLWEHCRVDLHFDFGQWSGLFGPKGERLRVREAFRQDRDLMRPKGVICLIAPHDSRSREP